MIPDSLLTEFREAYAKHGDALCWITATPDNQEPLEPCMGSVKLPPLDGAEQSWFWLSLESAFDGDAATRDFLPLAARAGAFLPADYRRGLSQPPLLEPAAAWCLALLRLSIERGRLDDLVLGMIGDGIGGFWVLEWQRPYAASVELLEILQGRDGGGDPHGGTVETLQPSDVGPERAAGPAVEPQDLAAGGDDDQDAAHGDDFRCVRWYGQVYDFTPTQAACVKVLWEHWERGTPAVGQDTILEAADASSGRLRDVFDKGQHPAWETMIVEARKGAFRLQPKTVADGAA